MSRTLGNLALGTRVYVPFADNTWREYIVIKQDAVSTVLFQNLVYEAHRMNPQNTTVYDGCEGDTWLNDGTSGFKAMLTQDMQDCLVPRTIETFVYGQSTKSTISRSIYFLSYYEVFGTQDSELPMEDTPVFPAFYLVTFQDGNGRIARRNTDSTAQYWWLRSPYSATGFRSVSTGGTANYNYASSSPYVRPALSVASATIVSPEGADTIYILPDGEPVTHMIDVIDYVGESAHRPTKAVVTVNSLGLNNVRIDVTNNAKDETPVWVNATGGGMVDLANDEKTTDKWQVAVRMHGESPNFGATMGEPYVITLEE